MRHRAIWSLTMLLAAGCATAPKEPIRGDAYTGEVWVWDDDRNTVTLRTGTGLVRLQVTPEQVRDLRLKEHQTVTVRGVPDAPMPIEHSIVTTTATTRPSGPADDVEVAGTVTALDPAGKVRVETAGGPVEVWTSEDGPQFKVGDVVRVNLHIQPLTLVLLKPGEVPPPSAPPEPPVGKEPGHYAAVRGAILDVQQGRITVESPRGPIIVPVPRSESYGVKGYVDVQSSVRPVK